MKTEKDLLIIARKNNNKTIKDIISEKNIEINKNSKDKGAIGNLIQEYVFGIKQNSIKEPDFKEIGVDMELKVTPLKKLKKENNGMIFSSKERLAISSINYYDLAKEEDFFETHLYEKIKKMLIMFYIFENKNKPYNSKILNSYIFNFIDLPEREREIIIQDYKTIHYEVISGKAHKISSKDTRILEAVRSGNEKKDEQGTSQPFSKELCYKKRFALKSSYMSMLFNRFYNNLNSEEYNFQNFLNKSYEKIALFLKDFIGKDLNNYDQKESKAKNKNGNTIRKLIKDWNKDLYKMVKDKDIKVRTMILKNNGTIQESLPISTNYIVQKEIINEKEFKKSRLYSELITPYIIVTINQNENNRIVNGVYLIENFLVKETYNKNALAVWQNTKDFFVRLKDDSHYNENNKLISLSDDMIFHIRPKTKNGSSKYDNTTLTKQAFWINKNDLQKIIDDYDSNNINSYYNL